jgi:hypothetical protein
MRHAASDAGLNPSAQPQNDVDAASTLHRPNGPHRAYASHTSRGAL